MNEFKDLPEDEVRLLAEDLISKGATIYIKWTCIGCGERATCDTPNSFFTEGFVHTEKENGEPCGVTTFPDKYGLVVMFGVKPEELKDKEGSV